MTFCPVFERIYHESLSALDEVGAIREQSPEAGVSPLCLCGRW